MRAEAVSSSAAPAIASRRAGPAERGAVSSAQAPPALAAELPANTKGSSRRASSQTGIEVSDRSAAV